MSNVELGDVTWADDVPVGLQVKIGRTRGEVSLDELWDHLAAQEPRPIDVDKLGKSARALVTDREGRPGLATVRQQVHGRFWVKMDGSTGGTFTRQELRGRLFAPNSLTLMIARWILALRPKMRFRRVVISAEDR